MLFFERVKVVLRKTKEEFFEISKNKRMTEKVFLTRITLSLVSIIVCILIMSVTAYAYFSHTIITQGVDVTTAICKVDITSAEGFVPTVSGYYVLENSENVQKDFVFSFTKDSTANAKTGYVKIEVKKAPGEKSEITAYTKQIGEFLIDGTAVIKNDRTITVRVAANQTVYVKITSHWGSCAITELVLDDATPIYADFGVPAESQSDLPRADGKPHSEETDSSNALFDD